MTTDVQPDRVAMVQRERDVLKVMQGVIEGKRTQAEAARLLRRSVRQVRRLQRKLETGNDGALVHGLRGRPSNHRADAEVRRRVLRAYRQSYRDFGPTLAAEKLAAEGLAVGVETLRRWLLADGLWERKRQRDPHRSRRPRRECFGELVQMDASIHDWLEGRGEAAVLIAMIDDATAGSRPGSTRPGRSRPTCTCWASGCGAMAGRRPCTPTGTAFSSPRTRGRRCRTG